MARITASVRLWALSLPMMEFTWNLTVCSLTSRRETTPLLGNPSANSFSTSCSLGVNSEAEPGSGVAAAETPASAGSVTCSPWLSATAAAAKVSGEASRLRSAWAPAARAWAA